MDRYYYIETDGMVYLLEDGERLCFPRSTEGLGFAVEPRWPMVIAGQEVLFCKPKIDYYPGDWWPKDEIPALDRADPLVRQAIHLSLPRLVAEGVIVEEGKVLLVKASRGFLKDQWNLPGGFVGYGESPPEAVAREVAEEVGAPCRVGRLLGVESFVGKKSYLHWHMFFYEVELLGREFTPAADEIVEVRWFPLAEAVKLLGDRVMSRKIRELFIQS